MKHLLSVSLLAAASFASEQKDARKKPFDPAHVMDKTLMGMQTTDLYIPFFEDEQEPKQIDTQPPGSTIQQPTAAEADDEEAYDLGKAIGMNALLGSLPETNQLNNFYGDITLVLGGDQTEIVSTSVQPAVAKHLIDAIKEIVLDQASEMDVLYGVDVLDWLLEQDNEFWQDVITEAAMDREIYESQPTWQEGDRQRSRRREASIHEVMKDVNFENCPFLRSLSPTQLRAFNRLHGTNLSRQGLTSGPARRQQQSLSDTMQEVSFQNCPFLRDLTENQLREYSEIHDFDYEGN